MRRCVSLAVLASLLCACGEARGMPLPENGDSVVGEVLRVRLKKEASALAVAERYAVGLPELARVNPQVDGLRSGRLAAGTELIVPTRYVLPEAPREGIVVNIAEKRLYFFPDDRRVLSFAAAVGREEWETPTGRTHVAERIVDPAWHPPDSIREAQAAQGRPLPDVVPAGPDNPLGRYALRLGWRQHLIHGTNRPRSVGRPVTHGCIRLYPEDIETLFEAVAEGTPVTLVDQPYKLGTHEGALFLESHPDGPSAAAERRKVLQRIDAWVREKKNRRVDAERVRRLLAASSGIPARISE